MKLPRIRLHSSLHVLHVEHVRQNGHVWPSENTESWRAAEETLGCASSEEVSAALYALTASSAPAGAEKQFKCQEEEDEGKKTLSSSLFL